MIEKSLNKDDMKRLLFESEVIGQGTYGLVVKYNEDTLLKIYYKNILDTFYSRNIEKLDEEISNRIEIEKDMIESGLKRETEFEEMKSKIQQLGNTKSKTLIKGTATYKGYLIGIFLENYKNYDKLTNIFSDLPEASQKIVLNSVTNLLKDLYKHGIVSRDLKEDNIMVRKEDLDVKLIDLDDIETRYEDKEYLNEYPHLGENLVNTFKEMKNRLEKSNIPEL